MIEYLQDINEKIPTSLYYLTLISGILCFNYILVKYE